jgi:hypothetical protein
MGTAVPTARQRRWTRIRDYSSERAYRELVRQHDLSRVPTILLKQFAQLGVRSAQYNRKIFELEKEAEDNGGRMDPEAWSRWTFLVTEHRRSALAIATLARSIFGDKHRPREIDLVSLMAQQAEDPPAEDPPNGEPPAEDPPAKEPPIEEPGKPAPMKSA